LVAGCRNEVLAEGFLAPKRLFDQACNGAFRFATTAATHALPVELVVPRLGRGIEESLVPRRTGTHDFLK
jgi:hypothetical protein